jgi:hypothetical protein
MYPRLFIPACFAFTIASAISTRAFADEPAAPTPGPAPTPTATTPAPTEGPQPITVSLHASDPGTRLERRTQTQTYGGLPFKDASLFGVATWEPACAAPCGVRLDPRFAYRVTGEGMVPSDPFSLPLGSPKLGVDAKMGSSTERLGGIALTGAGAAGLLLGGAALVASPILQSQDVGSQSFRTGVLAGGVVIAGAGAIALVSGLWLWMHSDTTYRVEAQASSATTARPRMTTSGFVF